MKKTLLILLLFALFIPIQPALAETEIVPVLSRGHIENLGDYPADHTWIESPEIIGTVGQSKRIEGFELKPDADVASEIELRYNVHVQNIGWLYDENDPSTWAKNGDYAGTRGKGLRIEAIKIVLLDTTGKQVSGYHVRYRGHVQNIGDLPAASEKWFLDGEQLGTVGSSLRLEALKLEIVKDATTGTDLSAYTALIKQIESLNESDFSKTSWNNLQSVVSQNKIDKQSSSTEIATAIATIQKAMNQLEDLTQSTIYSKAGSYGPSSGSESINQDVIVTTGDVTLQNLTIDGNLIIDEAVGNGNVTLNNVTVSGELRVRGGGQNSIHINGGDYSKILIEQAPDGGVRIVATGLDGVPVILSENAAGETLILEGEFDSVTVNAPNAVIKTQGQTSIKTLDVGEDGQNTAIELGSTTSVTSLALSAPTNITGSGKISKADISSDNVSFEKAPDNYTVDPEVVVPPVIPTPEPTPQPQPGGSGGDNGGGGYTPPSKISLSVTTVPTVSPSKTYDGTTATDVTNQLLDSAAITGIAIGDTVTVTATATYDNKNVGSNKDITITYNLSGAAASKYNPPATTTIKGEILTKPLSLPTTPISKEYDGTTMLDTVITEDIGQLAADNLTISRTATYLDNNVGANKTVNCFYTLSGNDAENYSAPADHSGTGTITKRTLTVSCTSLNINKTKTYDGSTDVFNGKGKIQAGNNVISVATGVAADPTIIVTATAAYDNQNAGDNRTITISYSIDSTSANNRYQVPATETISGANITARSLTIAAPTPVAKAYDGTANVFTEVNNTGIIYNTSVPAGNIADTDSGKVTVTATATYDTGKDVGPAKPITIRYTLSGDAAGNYQPLPDDHSKTAAITPLTLNTGTVSEKTKEYDGTSTAKLNVNVSCSDNNGLFASEAGKTLLSKVDSKYYTDSACQTETSKPSDAANLYIKYTITLEGTSASNYVFADNQSSLTGTTNGGSITKKKLSVTAEAMGLQTEKDYDGNVSASSTLTTITGGTGMTGIIGNEQVTATASSHYDSADAGNRTITTSFSLSGPDAGNYLIDPLISSGKINPIQLNYTGALPDNISSYASKTYDSTQTVKLNGVYIQDQDVTSDVNGILSGETAKVTATATFNDKNAGPNKPVTITYTVNSTNYLAPPANTGTITTSIDKRMLSYDDSLQLETLKKWDGKTSAIVIDAKISPATDSYSGIVAGDTVSLAACSGEYYSGNAPTSAVTPDDSWYEIRLTPTLSGTDAGNYQMETKTATGKILPKSGLVTASFSDSSWSSWGKTWGDYQTLTMPDGMKLFMCTYSTDGIGTFYGLGSDGKIYTATTAVDATAIKDFSLLNTTNYDGANILSGYQVFGLDADGTPLAVGSDGMIYFWSNQEWAPESQSKVTLQGSGAPINPTYYKDNDSKEYLIYQDSSGNLYKSLFGGSGATSICTAPKPLSTFTSELIDYNGSTIVLFAY
ncbi:YDG domain-containing protein [Acetobacterium sp. UBA5834]|jgi:hypothetical protein|uniref:YDG domain-containing protein n=1 Tax=Acetobacterium sp. UBA5834 TaxID=1945907 RepID=UPI00257D5907|nr:YDG domain-containing protein [Acetobacterium sp. UBA5834]